MTIHYAIRDSRFQEYVTAHWENRLKRALGLLDGVSEASFEVQFGPGDPPQALAEVERDRLVDGGFALAATTTNETLRVSVMSTTRLGALIGIRDYLRRLEAREEECRELFCVSVPRMRDRMISGNPSSVEQVPELFDALLEARINMFVFMPVDYAAERRRYIPNEGMLVRSFSSPPSFPFGAEHYPKFEDRIDKQEAERQLAITRAVSEYAEWTGMRMIYMMILPKFPVNDLSVIADCYPELVDDEGEFDASAEEFLTYLEHQLEEIIAALPRIEGLEFWLAEGAGATVFDYTLERLEKLDDYLPGWLEVIDRVARRHDKTVHFFTHHYTHSVETRRNLYRILEEYPDYYLMEDITWPEEHLSLETLASIDSDLRETFCSRRYAKLNFLLDTEYMGQGVVPSIFPRWWKQHVQYSLDHGLTGAVGRIFWWDLGDTLTNYNRGNIYCYGRLTWDYTLDPDDLLREYLCLRFGYEAGTALTPAFLAAERLVRRTFLINGVGPFDHAAFPRPEFIRPEYQRNGNRTMKNIDDLLQNPGTRLYGSEKNIRNVHQWRYQLRLHSLPVEEMVAEKRAAASEANQIVDGIDSLRPVIGTEVADRVSRGFATFAVLAEAMIEFLYVAYHDVGGRIDDRDYWLSKLSHRAEDVEGRYGSEFYLRLPERLRTVVRHFDEGR